MTEYRKELFKSPDFKYYDGFTLAEVLITLVIIGVIAAMTIPTLINKTNNHEYVSRLKKVYSTLSQATNKIIAEEGNPKADIGGWATSQEVIYNMYKKHLSLSKDCGLDTECAAHYASWRENSSINNSEGNYSLILADGSQIWLGNVNTGCSYETSGTSNICYLIHVDVNGKKGPNLLPKDVFAFAVKENGIFPVGCDYNGCKKTAAGWGCTCKAIRDNAINYL